MNSLLIASLVRARAAARPVPAAGWSDEDPTVTWARHDAFTREGARALATEGFALSLANPRELDPGEGKSLLLELDMGLWHAPTGTYWPMSVWREPIKVGVPRSEAWHTAMTAARGYAHREVCSLEVDPRRSAEGVDSGAAVPFRLEERDIRRAPAKATPEERARARKATGFAEAVGQAAPVTVELGDVEREQEAAEASEAAKLQAEVDADPTPPLPDPPGLMEDEPVDRDPRAAAVASFVARHHPDGTPITRCGAHVDPDPELPPTPAADLERPLQGALDHTAKIEEEASGVAPDAPSPAPGMSPGADPSTSAPGAPAASDPIPAPPAGAPALTAIDPASFGPFTGDDDAWGPIPPEALREEEKRREDEARAAARANEVPDSSAFADHVAERKACGARWKARPFHRALKKVPKDPCPLCDRPIVKGEVYRQEKDRAQAHDACVARLLEGRDPKADPRTEPLPADAPPVGGTEAA